MIKLMLFLIYQVVGTAGFFVWYARKHPREAKEMTMKWRDFFVRIGRSMGLRRRKMDRLPEAMASAIEAEPVPPSTES